MGDGIMNATETMKQTVGFWGSFLVGVCTPIAIQLVRALFPLVLYTNALSEGATKPRTVVITLAVILLAPLLAPLAARLISERRTLIVSFLAVAFLRLALQISPSANLNLVLTTLALVCLTIGCTA